MTRRLFGILAVILSLIVYPPIPAWAASPDSVKDTLSDARKAVDSTQTVVVDMSGPTDFAVGDTLTVTLAGSFTVPAFSPGDVSFNDGTARTVLAICAAGGNNISLDVTGQAVTLTACAGFTASGAGAIITIVFGTGVLKITNPALSGIYGVTVAGSYGDSSRTVSVAITEGVTVSLTIAGSSGSIQLTGDAFPGAIVTFLDNSVVVGNTLANGVSYFDKTLSGLLPGVHTLGIYGLALDGRKTLTISFNINVISGMTLTVSGILLPPIISIPSTHKRPAPLPQSGLARHISTVTTFTNNGSTITKQIGTDSNGNWSLTLPEILHLGFRSAAALVNDGGGNQSVLTDSQIFEILLSADLNIDVLVNLTDFSILMFNYGLSNPPNLAADINDEGHTDLVDFSVMMFYWTGG